MLQQEHTSAVVDADIIEAVDSVLAEETRNEVIMLLIMLLLILILLTLGAGVSSSSDCCVPLLLQLLLLPLHLTSTGCWLMC